MKEQHLRNYLLFSAYSILPGYLLCRYTFFGLLFPYSLTTTTSIFAGFLYGAILYVSTLIYSNVASSGFFKSPKLWKLIPLWIFLMMEFFSIGTDIFYNTWAKALVHDYRRTGQYEKVAKMQRQLAFYLAGKPKTTAYIFGTSPAPRPITPKVTQTDIEMPKDAPVENVQDSPKGVITPVRPTNISGISPKGALLDGKLRKWGKQEDGSMLSLNPDRTSVTLLTPDGETITLVLRVE